MVMALTKWLLLGLLLVPGLANAQANPRVRDVVAEILLYVNEEDTQPPDSSQASGAGIRAQKMRDALAPLETSNRRLNRGAMIQLFRQEITDPDIQAFVNALDLDEDGQDLGIWTREWVAKNLFYGGIEFGP